MLRGNYWVNDVNDFDTNFEITYQPPEQGIGGVTFTKSGTNETFTTSVIKAPVEEQKVNNGFVARRKPFLDKNIVPLCGRLHCDIFNINRYLLSNVDINIVLSRTRQKFYLKGSDAEKYKIYIEEAYLKIRRVVIAPSVMYAHAAALEKTPAKYPIKRVIVRNFVIPYQSTRFTMVGLHQGIMPTRVVMGFLKTKDMEGNFKDSYPFYFRNLKLSELNLKIASKSLPYSTSLKFDFHKDNYLEGYNTLFKNIREAPNDISYEDYKNGYTLFAFDLTPDLCSAEHYSILKDGSLDLDITCEGFTESYTLMVYMEFDNIILT